MKIKIGILLTAILIMTCGFVTSVYASENEQELFLNESYSEYQEIIGLKNEIFNRITGSHDHELTRELMMDDIDFSKAFKVYVNLDLFADSNISQSELNNLVSNAEYVWALPVDIDLSTAFVTISKVGPLREGVEKSLTQEELDSLKEMVGHWSVPAVSVYQDGLDYVQTVQDAIRTNGLSETGYTLQFFGGTYGMPSVFGLLSYPNGERYMIPVMEPRDVVLDNQTEELSLEEAPESTIKNGELYDFSEMASNLMSKQEIEESGIYSDPDVSTGQPVMRKNPVKKKVLFTLLGLGGVVGAVYLIYNRKYNRRKS